MSVFARLRMVRAILAAGIGLRATTWGVVVALTVLGGAAAADQFAPLGVGVRRLLFALAIIAASSVAVALLWRDRRVGSLRRVALWIEEREQGLEYTLVSAVETGRDDLVRSRGHSRWARDAAHRSLRAAGLPLLIVAIIAALVLSLPRGAVARIRSPRPGDALDRLAGRPASASRLSPLLARVRPPAYTHLSERSVDEPTDVRAIAGSAVVIEGSGDPTGIDAVVDHDTIHASADGDRWSITVPSIAHAVAVRLVDRSYQRLIAVETIADNAPVVTLTLPVHDTVLRSAEGRIALQADASDDFGIATAAFEYIVSSGEGETFTFKSGVIGEAKPNAKTSAINATLVLDALGLKPGDVIDLRAVAHDANDVTGPGVGASDTRTIRIARPDEYDSVAVEPAAPADAEKRAVRRAGRLRRLYLRGRPPQVVLDLAKIRLSGKEKGSSSVRQPRSAADSISQSLDTRLMRAIELAPRDASIAIDSLLVLRIDALTHESAFAGALGDAIRAMRAGRASEATTDLVRARRTLVGAPIVRDSLSRWGFVP